MATKSTIRTKDQASWPAKGLSPDSGAGSKARAALADLIEDQAGVKKIQGAYKKVVSALSGLSDDQQRAVCFCAASDWSLDALLAKAKEGRVQRPLDDRRLDKIRELSNGKALTADEFMALYSQAKKEIRYPARPNGKA